MTNANPTRLSRHEQQNAYALEREQAEQVAHEQARALRGVVETYVRDNIGPGFTIWPVTNSHDYGEYIGIRINSDAGGSYRLHFKAATSRGFSRRFEAIVTGDQFDKWGRYHTPTFRPRKDGTYNLKALLADVRLTLTMQLESKRRGDRREQAETASHATLNEIVKRTGVQLSGPSRVEFDISGLWVKVIAGAFTGGLVKVEISLNDPYRPADQVIALLTKLSLADGQLPPGYTVVGHEDVPDNHRVPGALYTVMARAGGHRPVGSLGSGRTREEAIENSLTTIREL